ncbi:TPR-like protein, partial [Aureobasidium melanogenum]
MHKGYSQSSPSRDRNIFKNIRIADNDICQTEKFNIRCQSVCSNTINCETGNQLAAQRGNLLLILSHTLRQDSLRRSEWKRRTSGIRLQEGKQSSISNNKEEILLILCILLVLGKNLAQANRDIFVPCRAVFQLDFIQFRVWTMSEKFLCIFCLRSASSPEISSGRELRKRVCKASAMFATDVWCFEEKCRWSAIIFLWTLNRKRCEIEVCRSFGGLAMEAAEVKIVKFHPKIVEFQQGFNVFVLRQFDHMSNLCPEPPSLEPIKLSSRPIFAFQGGVQRKVERHNLANTCNNTNVCCNHGTAVAVGHSILDRLDGLFGERSK